MSLVVYWPGMDHRSARATRTEAVEAYAKARAWPVPQSQNWAGDLSTAISTLERGDILFVPDLLAVSPKPSEQESILLSLIAKGVNVHILSLNGSVEPHLLSLREVWQAAQAIEREMDAALKQMEKERRDMAEEMEAYQNEVVVAMVEKWGVPPSLRTFDKSAEPANEVGANIRKMREERGLSQAQLGELAGVSKSAIQRAEAHGTAEKLDAILAALNTGTQADTLENSNGL
jgi:DNA-binding XRE family transcriptional regulator